jgi:hypothetical protein
MKCSSEAGTGRRYGHKCRPCRWPFFMHRHKRQSGSPASPMSTGREKGPARGRRRDERDRVAEIATEYLRKPCTPHPGPSVGAPAYAQWWSQCGEWRSRGLCGGWVSSRYTPNCRSASRCSQPMCHTYSTRCLLRYRGQRRGVAALFPDTTRRLKSFSCAYARS